MNLQILFLVLALIAEILGTIGGFGSSVFFVPIGNFYFDFYSVLGLTAIFHLSSNISKVFLFNKGLNKEMIFYVGLPSVVFVIIGAYMSKYIQSTFLVIGLGVFLVILSLFFLIKKNFHFLPSKRNSMIGGTFLDFQQDY